MRRTLRTLPLLAFLVLLAAFSTPAGAAGGSASCTVPFEIARSQSIEALVLQPGPYKLTVLDTSQMTCDERRGPRCTEGAGRRAARRLEG